MSQLRRRMKLVATVGKCVEGLTHDQTKLIKIISARDGATVNAHMVGPETSMSTSMLPVKRESADTKIAKFSALMS